MVFKKTKKQQEAIRLIGNKNLSNILLSGGSRSGKTTILCYALVLRALYTKSRHAILRQHFIDVKNSIGRDTMPKVLQFMGITPKLDKVDWFWTFPNGSEIWLGGLDDKDRVEKILGKEYSTIYFNESNQLTYDAVTTAQTRLAEKTKLRNLAFFDCNPPFKSHWLYQLFQLKLEPEKKQALSSSSKYGGMQMNPVDNLDNLPADYIEKLEALPERKRKRFLEGVWQDDLEGALWTRAMIDNNRVINAPPLVRVVVGVDPAVTAKADSDATGIVVVGICKKGHLWVLHDHTMQGATPYEWGGAVVNAYHTSEADRIVGETNQGGDLIEANLRNIDPNVSYIGVHASRGKITRAEPVAAMYEQNKVHHVGTFSELEDEMCNYNPQMQADGVNSPDRMDALVWACTYLTQHGAKSVRAHGTTRPERRKVHI